MTFDDFHSHARIQGIPLAALRTYFEAGRLSGCMEKLAFLRKEFEDRGLVPWSKELNYPPDNFQQERNCVPDRAVTSEPSRVKPCARNAEARPLAGTNFEQCGVESRNAHQTEASGESKKPGENQDGVASIHCSKIIPAQFVQHGRLESESYPAKNPSKGPPKIKKWMVR